MFRLKTKGFIGTCVYASENESVKHGDVKDWFRYVFSCNTHGLTVAHTLLLTSPGCYRMQRVTKHHGSHVYTLVHTKDQLILVTLPTGMFSGAQGNPKLQENQSCGASPPLYWLVHTVILYSY